MLVEHGAGHVELVALDGVRVGDDTAAEHVTRSRHGREPCRDETARARLRDAEGEPSRSTELQHELLDRPLVLGEDVARQRLPQLARERLGVALRPGLRDDVDVDLEVPRADRRLDTVSVAPRLGERPRHRRLAQPVEAEHAPARRDGPLQHALHGLALDSTRPEPLQLTRRPGQDDDRRPPRCRARARAPCRRHRGHAPLGHRRLLRHARREVGIRPAEPFRDRARERLDVLLELGVDDERPPGDPRDELDRAVVVRRPEAPRDEADVGLQALAERGLEIVLVVTDHDHPCRLQPERQRLAHDERPVAIVAVAPHELASRHDGDGARSTQELGAGLAVATSSPLAGTLARLPSTSNLDVCGRRERDEELGPREGSPLATLERAAVDRRARPRSETHLHVRRAACAADDDGDRRRGNAAQER